MTERRLAKQVVEVAEPTIHSEGLYHHVAGHGPGDVQL